MSQYIELLDRLEQVLVEPASRIGPLLAPLPTAYVVASSLSRTLAWPPCVAVVAGLTVELLGLSCSSTALMFLQHNRTRKAAEPGAPVWLAAALMGVYVFSVLLLSVFLGEGTLEERAAMAVFPFLGLSGYGILAARQSHLRVVEQLAEERGQQEENRREGQRRRREREKKKGFLSSRVAALDDPALSVLRLYALAAPETQAAAAVSLGVSRQTVGLKLSELERLGLLAKTEEGYCVDEELVGVLGKGAG